MKRLAILIPLLIAHSLLWAQSNDIKAWNKWCSRKDTMVLFEHGNNQVQVFSTSFKPSEVTVKSLDRSLRIGAPEIVGDTLNILAMPYPKMGKQMRLAVINNKTRKTLTTINCAYDSIPKLVATIGNLSGKEIPKASVLAQNVLRINFPKSLYSYPYRIKQYTFQVSTAKGSASLNVKGFFLTKDVLTEISNVPAGTEIVFTNIQATCPECVTKQVEDIRIKLR